MTVTEKTEVEEEEKSKEKKEETKKEKKNKKKKKSKRRQKKTQEKVEVIQSTVANQKAEEDVTGTQVANPLLTVHMSYYPELLIFRKIH